VTTRDLLAVSNTGIFVDDTQVGVTDSGGEILLSLPKHDGTVVQLTGHCPQGYRGLRTSIRLALRRLQRVDGQGSSAPLREQLTCEPTRRDTLVMVHAMGAPPLAVLIDGVLRATTNADGIAHVLLHAEAGTRFQIMLETSANPALLPQRPTRPLVVGDDDDVFVFEQEFKVVKPAIHSHPKVKIPYRID
jgi:hypothetical protein